MSIPGSSSALFLAAAAAGAGGYQVERSLRFNSSDSAYLSRTPASAGNRKTWSFSCWVKRGTIGGSYQNILSAANSVSDRYEVYFDTSTNQLTGEIRIGGTGYIITTTQVFRDPSAWYHILVVMDTSQATASNRHKFYVNGTQVTNFASASYPNQDATPQWNAADPHSIGRYQNGASQYLDGYLADIHFIDGQALDPSSFTEVSATTGQLIPKAYTGSYGTNGFKLTFSDNSGTTSTTLGKDAAGSNNWSPNNFSVASGSGNDSLVDTPTSYGTDTGAGGEVRGNYCTLNPFKKSSLNTLSNGNLDFTNTGAESKTLATFGLTSGKWYWECVQTSGPYGANGIAQQNCNLQTYMGNDAQSWGYLSNGGKYNAGASNSYGSSWTNNDVIGVAFDADAGKLWFSKNGTWQASGDPGAGTNAAFTGLINGPYFPAGCDYGATGFFNFGQRPFAYTAPSGFKALCDTNLPAPVVAKPNTVMDVITYTGTGSSLALPNGSSTPTSISFTPDFAWIKGRSGATDHALYDAVRGVQKDLVSNSTSAETTETTGLTAFGTNTFTVGSLAKLNTSSSTYVAWAWNAGGSTVTNTQGSITSSVRASASSGFSVATWTGSGSGSITVGHGLGVAPQFFIVKDRSNARNWLVYHVGMGATRGMQLNLTTGQSGADAGYWNNTAPTSTVATIGTYGNESANYVGYFWAPVTGYSSFGSYTGNGSTDGPFVFCGFRPRWLLIKSVNYADTWVLIDAARETYNVMNTQLRPNSSNAESVAVNDAFDFLSNGFKVRGGGAVVNTSSAPFIYAAFAESPFQYARAR